MHKVWLTALGLCSQLSWGQAPTQAIQLKYSPIGEINADYYDASQIPQPTDKYQQSLQPHAGLRWMYDPFYLSLSSADAEDPALTGAHINTFALGLSGIRFGTFESNPNAYLLGAIGLGAGKFTYTDPALDDWEAMFEASAEMGLLIGRHWLIGSGADYQAFGDLGDSKATGWRFYFSSGWLF